MPVMDGWEFLEEFRDRDDIQKDKIIIIILTTSINPADQKRAEGLTEVSRYCFKPLTLPMLTEIIEEYFPGNQ